VVGVELEQLAIAKLADYGRGQAQPVADRVLKVVR